MKKFFWLFLVLAFVLAACQPTQQVVPETPVPSPTPEQPEQTDVYPAPGAAPAPALPAAPASNSAYPEPGDPATASDINWTEAANYISTGLVAHAVEMTELELVLTLKDSRVFRTTQPSPSEVTRLREQCGYMCQGMTVQSP